MCSRVFNVQWKSYFTTVNLLYMYIILKRKIKVYYIIRLLQRSTIKFKMGFISSYLHIFTRTVSNDILNIFTEVI